MGLVAIRIALLVAAASVTGAAFSLALTPQLSALYFVPVNVVCLWLLRRRLRARGSSLRELAAFDRQRLGRDVALGLLWLFVLFIPFIVAVNLAMLLLFGPSEMLGAYETVFAPDPSLQVTFAPWFSLTSALLTAVLFPLTNAPAEELVYRGHAQGGLFAAGRPAWFALLLPALAFGAQHVLLAPSAAGMLVYAIAFVGWGLGAGLIYRRQGRLMPLIFAHFLTNAMFSVFPLVFYFLGPLPS
ncbi:MAG TPA: CPBP family intramembrane glutamic endopeptidase [Trueperaceae bacterium]|nr:CPBP family intramembrane glutamic endopeptidase [Trueperaceae bacterium]